MDSQGIFNFYNNVKTSLCRCSVRFIKREREREREGERERERKRKREIEKEDATSIYCLFRILEGFSISIIMSKHPCVDVALGL
jgi:hypothetical protein